MFRPFAQAQFYCYALVGLFWGLQADEKSGIQLCWFAFSIDAFIPCKYFSRYTMHMISTRYHSIGKCNNWWFIGLVFFLRPAYSYVSFACTRVHPRYSQLIKKTLKKLAEKINWGHDATPSWWLTQLPAFVLALSVPSEQNGSSVLLLYLAGGR